MTEPASCVLRFWGGLGLPGGLSWQASLRGYGRAKRGETAPRGRGPGGFEGEGPQAVTFRGGL